MEDGIRKKKRNILWLLLFVLVNALIIAWIAFREFHNSGEVARFALGEHGALFLTAAFGCMAVVLLTETVKFLITARSLREALSFRDAFETVALGKYYDSITPTGGGGQPFQMYWLYRKGLSTKAATAVAAAGFITRQLAAILVALLTFFLWRGNSVMEGIRYVAWAGLVCCAFPPCFEIAFSLKPDVIKALIRLILRCGAKLRLVKDPDGLQEKIIHSLMQYREGFLQIGGNALLTLELMLLSVLCRIALCSIPYFVLLSLGCRTGYLDTLALTVYIYAAVTLIPTPGNSGVSEGAFYLVFSGIGSSGVFWAMLLWRLVCYYSLLLLGLLLFGILTRRYIRKPAPDSGTQEHNAEHSDPAEQQ